MMKRKEAKDQNMLCRSNYCRVFLQLRNLSAVSDEKERLSSVLFSTSKKLFQQQFVDSSLQHIICPTKVFLFQENGDMQITLILNIQNLPFSVKKRILNHFFELFRLFLPLSFNPKKKKLLSTQSATKFIRLFRHEVTSFILNYIPALFGGVSTFPSSRRRSLLDSVIGSIVNSNEQKKEGDQNLNFSMIHHVLVFVDSKLLSLWSRDSEWVFSPKDLSRILTFSLCLSQTDEKYEILYLLTGPNRQNRVSLYIQKSKFQVNEEKLELFGFSEFLSSSRLEKVYTIVCCGDCDLRKKYVENYETLCGLVASDVQNNSDFLKVVFRTEIMMSQSSKKGKEDREIAMSLLKNNMSFLFCEKYPGLLFLVFVNRVRGIVTCSNLEELKVNEDFGSFSSVRFREKIHRYVFQCFEVMEKWKELGYSRIILFQKEVTFSYLECFVMKKGKKSFCRKELLEKMSQKNGSGELREHFEVYCIFLPFVTLQSVEKMTEGILEEFC